jgi:hypothetical protein
LARQEWVSFEASFFLSKPAQSVVVKELRHAYQRFQRGSGITELLGAVLQLSRRYGGADQESAKALRQLRREDLQLICLDHLRY